MDKAFSKALNMETASEKEFKAQVVETNKTAIECLESALAILKSGKAHIKGMVFGLSLYAKDDADVRGFMTAGEVDETLILQDRITFAIARATIDSETLIPGMAIRLIPSTFNGAVPAEQLKKLAEDAQQLHARKAAAETRAANDAEAAIKKAAGQ